MAGENEPFSYANKNAKAPRMPPPASALPAIKTLFLLVSSVPNR
jgi:hypothetical protein